LGLVHIFSYPAPWELFASLTLIYAGFMAGMAWQFRVTRVPATQWRGRLWFAGLLIIGGVLFAWRNCAIHTGYVSGGRPGVRDEPTKWSDRELTRQYDPQNKDNRLVRVPAPMLNGSPLSINSDHPMLDGATAFYPLYAAAASAIYRREWLYDALNVSSTPNAYKNLLEGRADLIFALYPSPEQLAEARERGVEYRFTPLGREAFVFFVNENNPVANLTDEQVRAIYTKRVTDWAQVGGHTGKILAFQRPANSGSQTTMEQLVMRGEAPVRPLMEELAQSMGGIVREVAAYRNDSAAIGYSFRFFIRDMAGQEKLRLLSINGVPPTPEMIRSGEYLYVTEFYAVTTAATAEKPNVKKLLAWLQSGQGRELIEKVGYVAAH
jgi:phosphate transport system substrate-binding protein